MDADSHSAIVRMFSLVYGFIDYLLQKDELRVLLLGLDGAGKTSLLERLKTIYTGTPGLTPDKIRPTVGLNVGRIESATSKVNFQAFDGKKAW